MTYDMVMCYIYFQLTSSVSSEDDEYCVYHGLYTARDKIDV